MQEAQQEWRVIFRGTLGCSGREQDLFKSPSLQLSWGPHQPDSRAQACSHTYSFIHSFIHQACTLCLVLGVRWSTGRTS